VQDIKTQIESGVVGPIFASIRQNGHRDQSLPEIVFDNRKNRAYARVRDALVSRGAATIPAEMRTRLESMIEKWSGQAFDDTFQPIQEFEIQCARERDLVLAEESGDPQKVLDVQEKDYRRRVIERFGSIELRGIQLNHRVILDLDQVYIPLHFEELSTAKEDSQGRVVLSDKARSRSIGELLKKHPGIFVIGAPGSGKSTLVSYLASRCAMGTHDLPLPPRALPFVITVRELKDAAIGPEWIAAQLGIQPALVTAALSSKRAVLLIDGLDEAPEQLRGELTAALLRFLDRHPVRHVVVTSRPAGAPGEIESRLPGFRGFRVTDLLDDEINAFIDKWCLAAERSASPDSNQARDQASAAAADLKSRIARSRPVQRIAVNPLLTTILCVVHRFLGRTIPEHRVTLYEKCTDALLYEWDRAKFPKDAAVGNLDANQKRALLRGVASALHEKHEAEMAEAEVVRHFATMLPEMGQPQEDAVRIVREIRDRSGVLVERRPGTFGFSHLTFQEYLTALDYASRSHELLCYIDDAWWHEVIALAAGIPGSDSTRIIDSFLGKNSPEAIIMAVKCMETAISVPLDLRKKVESALERILPGPIWLDERLPEIGLTVAPILARRLSGYNPHELWSALAFFRSFLYEPVVPTLVQLTSRSESTSFFIADTTNRHYMLTVGDTAVSALYAMARTSDRARSALISVLSTKTLNKRFFEWLKPWKLLGDEFKAPRQGKRASTRAKNTA
jgi:hypothetical protein